MNAVYDKQDAESARAFAAFVVYRDMGPKRSLMSAWRQHSGNEKATSVPGSWTGWSEQFNWGRRAEAFDADEDRRRREEARETHRQELEAYRQRVITGARKRADAANTILDKVYKRLYIMNIDEISAGSVPAFMREAMAMWKQAVETEGVALGLLDENGRPVGDAGE